MFYLVSNVYYIMPVSLTNSIDIIANSVSVVQNYVIANILGIIYQITGLTPETLDTLQKLAESINNDNTFYSTINNQLASKAISADVYTQLQKHSHRLKLITIFQQSKIPLHSHHF